MTKFCIASVDCLTSTAPTEFVKSIHETGFAVLRNHPIESVDIERMYTSWGLFFASDTKFDYLSNPETHDGYFPYRSENAKSHAAKDLKEFYHIYPQGRLPQDIREISLTFYTKMLTLGDMLLDWIQQEAPASVTNTFSEPLTQMMNKSEQSLLRILHYPPIEEDIEPGAVRAAAHEDINLITLLVTGSEPGLQAQDSKGTWHDIPCDAGMIAVNVGDMLQKASRGYFPSTTHRVVNPNNAESSKRSRYSMPMFMHPRTEVQLDNTYTAGSYLAERLAEIGLKS